MIGRTLFEHKAVITKAKVIGLCRSHRKSYETCRHAACGWSMRSDCMHMKNCKVNKPCLVYSGIKCKTHLRQKCAGNCADSMEIDRKVRCKRAAPSRTYRILDPKEAANPAQEASAIVVQVVMAGNFAWSDGRCLLYNDEWIGEWWAIYDNHDSDYNLTSRTIGPYRLACKVNAKLSDVANLDDVERMLTGLKS